MAYSYKSGDRDQQFLLPPSMLDWLPEDHLVWFVLDVVEMVDTSAFHARHPNDGVGRRAYDPQVMLALLIYAYCGGMRSSRRIATGCVTDLAFKVAAAGLCPDHRTIAAFRADHQSAIEQVFVDVLGLCAAAGLADLGTIAIDGTKVGSDAALDANRSGSWIRRQVQQILDQAASADGDQAAQPDLGGSLPDELARPGTRRARLQAALGQIEADEQATQDHARAQAAKAADEAAHGRRLRGRKPTDPHAALARAEADVAAATTKAASVSGPRTTARAQQELSRARAALQAAQQRAQDAPVPEVTANTTDAQSRIMKTASGWVQGYNCQAAVNTHQIVLAADVTQDHNDLDQLLPMMAAVTTMATAAGIFTPIGTILADAGYWSEGNATADGPDRLIATTKDHKQRRAARELGTTEGDPPDDATPIDAMEHRLRTPDGAAAYAQRSHTVEPVFGQIKHNRGCRRFMRRGLAAGRSEWHLMCATSNLVKLFTHADGRRLATILA